MLCRSSDPQPLRDLYSGVHWEIGPSKNSDVSSEPSRLTGSIVPVNASNAENKSFAVGCVNSGEENDIVRNCDIPNPHIGVTFVGPLTLPI